MKITLVIITCLTLFLFGCKEQIKTVDNNFVDVIDPETFALILAESQLIEAHTTIMRVNKPYFQDSVENYYAALFEKYEVTSDAFYYSMKAYSYRPDELNAIYDQAVIHLEKLETDLADELIISKPITTISRQLVGDIIMETPFVNSILNDSTGRIMELKDSVFQYINLNDSIVSKANTNMESFQYSFIEYSHTPPLYMNLKSYIKGKLEKENGID